MNVREASPSVEVSSQPRSFASWMTYGLIFSLLWIVLTKGEAGSWVIGLLVIPAATWCVVKLFQRNQHNQSIRAKALIGFAPFFLSQSLRGGWGSAMFAIAPSKRRRHGFIRFRTSLPEGRPRLYLVHIVSLLPGTVTADWQGDSLLVHALDIQADNRSALGQCEAQIAALFGLQGGRKDSAKTVGAGT